jgi:molybdopterin-guanine dinucleotide biosynthesis protein A
VITALILAGGKATRLGGIAKHEVIIEGRTIFARQCAVLGPRVHEILVSGVTVPGHRCVHDAEPGLGPLGGIAAGLTAATTPWLLVMAGDMPYVSGPLIELIAARCADAPDAVGLRVGGLPEPLLCALRVASARPDVARRLAARELKASRLLTDGALQVAWLEEPALRAIDPTLRVLFNVNTPSDIVH